MKRILAVTLALVLLMAALPLTAMAGESVQLSLDEAQEFMVESGEEIACHYTAEEDGKYVLECLNGEWDYYAKRLDAEGNVLEETDDFAAERFEMELAAGETAYFVCGVADDFEGEISIPVVIWQVVPVTGVDLCGGRNGITVSLFGNQWLHTDFEPANATPMSITCEAEDAFMLDAYVYWDDGIEVEGYEVGETTVTVTMDGKHTDTVTVWVEEPREWGELGTQWIILNPYRNSRTYHFTPKESGWYEIFSEGDQDPCMEVWAYDEENEEYYQYDSSDDAEGFNFGLTVYLEEGVDYYLMMSAYSEFATAFAYTATVQKAEESEDIPETGIGFLEDSLTVTVGDLFFPDGWLGTEDNMASIESSDETVVSASLMEGCYALKAGEATLTVTAESGASDTLKVTVVEPSALVLDQRTEVTVEVVDGGKSFYFTPEESGTYLFRSFSSGDPYIELYEGEELLDGNDDSSSGLNFYLEVELTAGKTYLVKAKSYRVETYEFVVTKPAPATSITLTIPEGLYTKNEGDTYYVPVGGFADFRVSFGEAQGAAEEPVEVYLEDESLLSSDPNMGSRWAAVGETTVTVESESGLSDTITVVVYGYLPGDYNLNGRIDQEDVAAMEAYLKNPGEDPFFFLLDCNEDGVVDAEDEVTLGEMMPFQFLWGDVDGDETITSTDARLVLQYYAGKITEEDLNIDLADVDGDGDITSTDARLILQYYAGKIDSFPVDAL